MTNLEYNNIDNNIRKLKEEILIRDIKIISCDDNIIKLKIYPIIIKEQIKLDITIDENGNVL